VVDEELTSAIEELRERARAVVGVEAVVLLHRHPRQVASLAREFVPHSRVLLLALQRPGCRGDW
jgi:hypothetical protein